MRVVQNPQMQLGEIDFSQIKFNLKSRDDIPKILRGLQFVYMDLALREKIFALLEKRFAPKVDKRNGRPGMPLWTVFVCGIVRLDLNIDYDRLLELINEHRTLRAILGHGEYDTSLYHFQTLKDNVCRLTPELLDEINQLVVDAGHVLVKKRPTKRCVGGATPLWLKRTFTSRPTSTCSTTRCAVSSRSPHSGATGLIAATGGSTNTMFGTSND
jgi:transposase, IS5 family